MTAADGEQPVGMRWRVTKAVRASRSLAAPAKLIMLVLADIADVGTAEIPERWTPSLTVLARETSLGRSTVAGHLRELEADGWVVRTRPPTAESLGRGERTRYQLRVPDGEGSPGDELPGPRDELGSPGGELPQSSNGTTPVQEMDHPSAGAGHRYRSSSDQDQISSDPSSSPAKPPKAPKDEPHREDVERVCTHLAEWIVKNGSKPPTIGKKWRTAARLLIDKDGRTVDQILRAIDWCQNDEFWKSNILSMPTLREKYDQLRLAAQRKPRQAGTREYNGLQLNERTIADLERRQRMAAMDAANGSTPAIEGGTA